MRTLTKSLFLCIFLCLSGLVIVSAQTTTVSPKIPVDTVTKLISYSEVVQQTGIKDTLYNRVIRWGNAYYKNFQNVAKVLNKESGKIEGTHMFKVLNAPDKDGVKTEAGVVSYSFTIEIKENKFRYTITKFNLKGVSYFALERWLNKKDPSYQPAWDGYLTQVDAKVQELITSLKKGMKEAVKVSDDW